MFNHGLYTYTYIYIKMKTHAPPIKDRVQERAQREIGQQHKPGRFELLHARRDGDPLRERVGDNVLLDGPPHLIVGFCVCLCVYIYEMVVYD